MSVGNDVVDLDDAESRLEDLHPRWAERVFSGAERAALAAADAPHRLHWALWAAKESAYKALRRRLPDSVFSPVELEVQLPALPLTGTARGRVLHRGRPSFALQVRLGHAFVHAVATSEDEAAVLSCVETSRREPSLDVRRLATGQIGRALGLDPADLRIEGRPPVVRHEDREIEVSLSHHGRFVAFACAPPDRSRAR